MSSTACPPTDDAQRERVDNEYYIDEPRPQSAPVWCQPSVILKKIAATLQQNGLLLALREIGRIERSIFMCDWLLNPKLRCRSHAILNKGESCHALARAV